MDRGVQHPQERQDSNNTLLLTVPPRTLLVLCGAAGSGKSTFAEKLIETHQHLGFKPTMIVSSDTCRAIVCDDENNQQANRDAFDQSKCGRRRVKSLSDEHRKNRVDHLGADVRQQTHQADDYRAA